MNSSNRYHKPSKDQKQELENDQEQQRRSHKQSPHTPVLSAAQSSSKCQQPYNKIQIIELSDNALPRMLVTDGYQLGSTMGYGAYSKVRMVLQSLPGNRMTRLACKVINKTRVNGGSYVRKFLPRELEVLRTVRHPHVIRTHRIYATPSTVYVFMDYCERGDLLNHIVNVKSMPHWQVQTFFK